MRKGENILPHEQAGFQDLNQERLKKVKEEFLKPFTDEEINLPWEKYHNSMVHSRKFDLVHRNAHGYDYVIFYMDMGDKSRKVEFQITGPEQEKLASLIFINDFKDTDIWHITHRQIDSGDLRISGTEFLQKAEEYMKLAAESKNLKLYKLAVAASQEGVIKWFLKNGYEFTGKSEKNAFQSYLDHPENYQKIYISDSKNSMKRELFLFYKSEINPDEITKYMTGKQDGQLIITVDHQDMLYLQGLVRLHLQKTFNNDLAKPE